MRELRDDSLIDMKFMIEDAGYTAKYFYSQINAGKLPNQSNLVAHHDGCMPTTRTGNEAFSPL